MNRKISTLLFAVIIMVITVASDVLAQNYSIQNTSPVPVNVIIQVNCPGPPPVVITIGPFIILPGQVVVIPIPSCPVVGVILNGTFYPVGYNGPVVPPNPPTLITVTPLRTIIR